MLCPIEVPRRTVRDLPAEPQRSLHVHGQKVQLCRWHGEFRVLSGRAGSVAVPCYPPHPCPPSSFASRTRSSCRLKALGVWTGRQRTGEAITILGTKANVRRCGLHQEDPRWMTSPGSRKPHTRWYRKSSEGVIVATASRTRAPQYAARSVSALSECRANPVLRYVGMKYPRSGKFGFLASTVIACMLLV